MERIWCRMENSNRAVGIRRCRSLTVQLEHRSQAVRVPSSLRLVS